MEMGPLVATEGVVAMCGMCGKMHPGTLVSSKKSLQDFEIVEDLGDKFRVQEVDVLSTEAHYTGEEGVVYAHDVEPFEQFYSRMH